MIIISKDSAVLSREDAKALVAHASKDQTRLHMNGVCIDWSSGAFVATDGHRVAQVNSGATFIEPMVREFPAPVPVATPHSDTLIPLEPLERATKLCRKKGQGVHIRVVERYVEKRALPVQDITLTAVDPHPHTLEIFAEADAPADLERFSLGAVTCQATDAQFPPWEQVLPSSEGRAPASMICMNTNYLADLVLVAIAAGNTRTGDIVMYAGGELDPVLFRANNWSVAIMPLRI